MYPETPGGDKEPGYMDRYERTILCSSSGTGSRLSRRGCTRGRLEAGEAGVRTNLLMKEAVALHHSREHKMKYLFGVVLAIVALEVFTLLVLSPNHPHEPHPCLNAPGHASLLYYFTHEGTTYYTGTYQWNGPPAYNFCTHAFI